MEVWGAVTVRDNDFSFDGVGVLAVWTVCILLTAGVMLGWWARGVCTPIPPAVELQNIGNAR